MNWPFENDTSAVIKKLANRSMRADRRRSVFVLITIALAAFLICLTAVLSVSVGQLRRSQAADTYKAVFTGIEESDVSILKEQPGTVCRLWE